MIPHPLALHAAEACLAMVDRVAPGLVEGFYIVGSVALDDFRPAISDLDFVIVTGARPGDDLQTALAEGHARLDGEASLPKLDGVYATWDELLMGPFEAPVGPCVEAGLFVSSDIHGRHPMTWGVLRRVAVTLRGPLLAGATIWWDPGCLERWAVESVGSYWRPSLSRMLVKCSPEGVCTLDGRAIERTVLGLCRLHYILATGVVPSRSDAGLYGLISLPRTCHRIIEEALRIRREPAAASIYADPEGRHGDVLKFVRVVLADLPSLASADVRGLSGRRDASARRSVPPTFSIDR